MSLKKANEVLVQVECCKPEAKKSDPCPKKVERYWKRLSDIQWSKPRKRLKSISSS